MRSGLAMFRGILRVVFAAGLVIVIILAGEVEDHPVMALVAGLMIGVGAMFGWGEE